MKKFNTKIMVQMALMISIVIVMGMTPIGFIRIPPISITMLHLPVIVGSIVLGPLCGGILGLTFGLVSMWNAIINPLPPPSLSWMLSPFASGYPLQSIFICLAPRIALGILPALLMRLFDRKKTANRLSIGFSAGISTIAHTFMFLGCINLFPSEEVFMPIMSIVKTVAGLNGSLEFVAAITVSVAICKSLIKYTRGNKNA